MIAYPERTALIRAAMVAFCAGDALGLPWAGVAPERAAPDGVGVRAGLPRGSTSSASDELLLAARVLEQGDAAVERRLLEGLAGMAPRMRDPATDAAVARYLGTGAVRAAGGATNGATVRAPAAGWATARRDARGRRKLVLRLARPTHVEPAALGAACVVAAMTAAGLESRDAVAAAEREARDGPASALGPVLAACAGQWEPPREGVAADAAQTAAAVVHTVAGAPSSLDAALTGAVRLGGAGHTVAALVGAVVGPRFAADPPPSWLADVRLPPAAELDARAAALAARPR